MKKLLCSLALFLFILTGCDTSENDIYTGSSGNDQVTHFFGIKRSKDAVSTYGIAQKNNLWHPSAEIKIKFLNGTKEDQEKVKNFASEWGYFMGISFNYVTKGNADVRIGFDWNDNRYITWSYIGTDCKLNTDQNDATMNFAFWNGLNDLEIRGDVLRAFGLMLGLQLEHRHVKFTPGWRSMDRLKEYWASEIGDVLWEDIQKYVFDPLETQDCLYTPEYDEQSIMIWPFANKIAQYTARSFNYWLSPEDRDFISMLYPKNDTGYIRMTTAADDVLLALELSDNKLISIDWGDGVEQWITKEEASYLYHAYADSKEHTIKISGDTYTLISLSCDNNQLTYLDVSKFYSLQKLYCNNNQLTGLNLYEVWNLSTLNCSYNRITTLDVYGGINDLNCYGNRLSKLDVSYCTSLKTLNCNRNNLAPNNLILRKGTDISNFIFTNQNNGILAPQYVE